MHKEIFSCKYNSKQEGTQANAKKKLQEFLKRQELAYCRRFRIGVPTGKFYVEKVMKGQINKRAVLTSKQLSELIIHGTLPYNGTFRADYTEQYSVQYVMLTGELVIFTSVAAYSIYPLTETKLKKLKVTDTEPVLDVKRLAHVNLVPLKINY